ncbi:MAG TPA: phenylalanine--tRNA ligase subunit alpha [Candidatus Acidoferrum sp.]|nr:phenylalanine--tRNA ligase subunit alpha [Candidatus Acidoferrum sp.]
MAEILDKIDQQITQLNLSSPEEVKQLFSELREEFAKELGNKIAPKDLEELRVRWLGRRERSVRRRVAANWLKIESPFRQQAGQLFQDLLAENGLIETKLSEHRANWDAIPALAHDQAQYPPFPIAVQHQYSHASNQAPIVQPHDWGEQSAAAQMFPLPEDLSLPGVTRPIGSHHLIRQVFQEIEDIFFSIGFSVVEGPEIETPYYNFEALNIPEFHPVRDDMDTFYLDLPKGAPTPLLLRTHTSPMQIRTMEKRKPPVRVIVPGKVYRRDNPDATHSFIFHQVEGLAVDADITFCDFTGTIEYFVKQFFGPGVKTRFRPSYFPFTEPSVEFDVSCIFCGGSGASAGGGTCSKCKGAGWIELFGAGMVDPAVYGFVNYDAKKVSGFAFGMGIDRLAMLKYQIDDIQVFFQNDVRFLRQFP